MSNPASAAAPRIGVGVILQREGLVLVGERIGSHGAGSWALPGGHLEFGESIEHCARREVLEETGLTIDVMRMGPFTNDVFAAEGQHYVTLFVLASCPQGQARVLEPTRCRRWDWFDWHALPQPLFQPLQTLLATGFPSWPPGAAGLD